MHWFKNWINNIFHLSLVSYDFKEPRVNCILIYFRIRREEEAKRAMEEARRLAEEMARKQAEMEARLKFNRTLQVEARGLDHSHNITEAFVFSYFELLNWFGLDVPEFELLKLNQY